MCMMKENGFDPFSPSLLVPRQLAVPVRERIRNGVIDNRIFSLPIPISSGHSRCQAAIASIITAFVLKYLIQRR